MKRFKNGENVKLISVNSGENVKLVSVNSGENVKNLIFASK